VARFDGTAQINVPIAWSPARDSGGAMMHMHFEDHRYIESIAQSFRNAEEFKRKVFHRLHRVYPTSRQIEAVIDQVLAEMKPRTQRASKWLTGGMENVLESEGHEPQVPQKRSYASTP
jgi:hypothetical protein